MKVFLTGGAGFVGLAAVEALLSSGHTIHALVNQKPVPISDTRVISFPGGLFDHAAMDNAMQGCDAVLHLVGIIAEEPSAGITFEHIHCLGTAKVLEATKRAGITRYLHMSALGASPISPAVYHQTKYKAEQSVKISGLQWTIFEPSLIHGPGGDFTRMQRAWACSQSLPYFFMPYFGAGLFGFGPKFKVQPVFVRDVARAFAETLNKPETFGQLYKIGGAEQLTWPDMHRIAAEIITGKPRPALPIPAWYASTIASLLPSKLLPFTRDQVRLSQQDNICDLTDFTTTFGWTPMGFADAMRLYAADARKKIA